MRKLIVAVVVTALGIVGCSSTTPEDQLVQELANQDKETIYQRAEDLYQKKDYSEARKLFSFLYDTFPNDPLGHKAALRVADTYSVYKDTARLTEARLRYRDFANRYPNDPQRDYALLMLGYTYTTKRIRPDRDLTDVHEGVKVYQQLINLYPNSSHIAEARERLAALREVLAEHEWQVARYYARNKEWLGTIWRLEYLKENYPEYPSMDAVDNFLAEAKKQQQERAERAKQRRKSPEEPKLPKPSKPLTNADDVE